MTGSRFLDGIRVRVVYATGDEEQQEGAYPKTHLAKMKIKQFSLGDLDGIIHKELEAAIRQ